MSECLTESDDGWHTPLVTSRDGTYTRHWIHYLNIEIRKGPFPLDFFNLHACQFNRNDDHAGNVTLKLIQGKQRVQSAVDHIISSASSISSYSLRQNSQYTSPKWCWFSLRTFLKGLPFCDGSVESLMLLPV